jgi:PAS domain S-box-containing protein
MLAALVTGAVGYAIYAMRRGLLLARMIAKEFAPNGGGSIRDQIVQIKQMVWHISARQVALVDGLGDPMFEVDSHGAWVHVNRAFQALTQRTPEDMLGSAWENVVVEADRDRVWDSWCDAIERRRAFEATFRIKAADGSVFEVDAVAAPIRDAQSVSGWLGRVRNIVPIAEAPTKRRASHARVN